MGYPRPTSKKNIFLSGIHRQKVSLPEKKCVNVYPFGLEHKGYNNVVSSSNLGQNYKFNGVELNEDLGLDLYEMDFRFYDPAVPHFTTIDPMAEERYWMSPYNFGQNNPISRVDPTGLIDWVYDKDKEKYVWDANVTSADDVDLADNAEYVGISKDDIDTHFKENNNWYSRFGGPDIDTGSFNDYIDSEINSRIEKALKTYNAGSLGEIDMNIRGLKENQVVGTNRFLTDFNLDISMGDSSLSGYRGVFHRRNNSDDNKLTSISAYLQKFNSGDSKYKTPGSIEFYSPGIRDEAIIQLRVSKKDYKIFSNYLTKIHNENKK